MAASSGTSWATITGRNGSMPAPLGDELLQAADEAPRLFGDFARRRHIHQCREPVVYRQFLFFRAGQLSRDDGDIKRRHIKRQPAVVAVKDGAAPGCDRQALQAQFIRLPLIFIKLQDLQLIHADAEYQEDGENHRLEEGQAPSLEWDQPVGFHASRLASDPCARLCGAICNPPFKRRCNRRVRAYMGSTARLFQSIDGSRVMLATATISYV